MKLEGKKVLVCFVGYQKEVEERIFLDLGGNFQFA